MRKPNLERMRKHRYKHLPQYRVKYIAREAADSMGQEFLDFIMGELLEDFAEKMRRRHMWTKKVFVIETYQDYDIDFNRLRFTVQERFVKERCGHLSRDYGHTCIRPVGHEYTTDRRHGYAGVFWYD